MSATKYPEKGPPALSVDTDPSPTGDDGVTQGECVDVTSGSQALHRKLRGKEVQLFAIGGAIGTCTSMFRELIMHKRHCVRQYLEYRTTDNS